MELLIINIAICCYIMVTSYKILKHRNTMTDTSFHHLISHSYMVVFFMVAINLYVHKGYTIPLLFVFLHVLQHIMKENIRLFESNKWTESVKD